jgi:hypothetical protein
MKWIHTKPFNKCHLSADKNTSFNGLIYTERAEISPRGSGQKS